jgi:hypothetical protein
MRLIWAILIAALTAHPTSARAQPAQPQPYVGTPPPPLAPADMANYCVYENQVYSLGAGLCFGKTSYTCVPSIGPATGNRAFWTNKEDQVFSRPVCN